MFASFFGIAQGQTYLLTPLPLGDLSVFREPSKNWKIVGNVSGSFTDITMKTAKGDGMLFNDFKKDILYKDGVNIFTRFEHGDIFLSLDFVVPKGSNSGIYLQGRYEIQLFDSWLVKTPRSIDCGSIYERWDDSKPEGVKGFEGHPAQTNACLAPNVWQHLDIEFQAPRFDTSGKRVTPARFLKVILNGVVIQENVVLFGPTRATAFSDEKPTGPIMIQGDHGSIAFRNINYALLNNFNAPFSDVKYAYYEGKFNNFNELTKDKLTREGNSDAIDLKLADNPNAVGLVFTGDLKIEKAEEYQFMIQRNGMTTLSVDGETILNEGVLASRKLSAGTHTLRLGYIKNHSWGPGKLGLSISKLNSRPLALHGSASIPSEVPAPLIHVEPIREPEIVRSFMMHDGRKKTHIISVGDPSGINFSYDLDQAALIKMWRGDFLNVTEMWYERGEPQLALPIGASIELMGRPVVAIVANDKAPLPDTINYYKDFIFKGYVLNEKRLPVFSYQYQNVTLEDALRPAQNARGITRSITLKNVNPTQIIYVRLAAGKSVEKVGDNVYAIDNQQFYIQLTDNKVKPEIMGSAGKQELVVPCTSSLTIEFSLIW